MKAGFLIMKNNIQNNKIDIALQKRIEYKLEKKYVKRLEMLENNIKELQHYRDQLKEKYEI